MHFFLLYIHRHFIQLCSVGMIPTLSGREFIPVPIKKIIMATLEKEMNVNGVVNSIEKANGNSTQRKRKSVPPMWRILGKARNVFDVQLSKSNEIKLQCIEKFMNAEIKDTDKFWSDFMEQVDKLLDSRRYITECMSLECKPENIAEHIVFLGSATINKVLKDGVQKTLGNDLRLYTERISPKDADVYRSSIVGFLTAHEPVTA